MADHDSTRAQILRELAAFSHQGVPPDFLLSTTEQAGVAEQGKWLSALAESSSDVIAIASLDGQVRYLNRAGRQLLGLVLPHEVRSLFDLFPEEEQRQLQSQILPALLQSGQWIGEFWLRHFQTGELIPFDANLFLMSDAQTGQPRALATIARELTESKRLQQRLRESEEFYRTLTETLPVTVVLANPQGIVSYISPAAKEMFGVEPGDGLGTRPTDWIAPEHHPVVYERMRKVLVELRPQPPIEYRMLRQDGLSVWASVTSAPFLDAQGRLKGVISVFQNVTDRRRAEEQLKGLNETLEQRVAERTAMAEHRAAQLRTMAAELAQAEQRERRRIAQILHDHLQQILVAARLKLDQLSRRIETDQFREAISQIDHLLKQSIAESRSLTAQLSPSILFDRGLAAGLEWLGRLTHEKYLLTVHVSADPEAEPAAETTRVFLFQAVRELLLNVAKHAQAQQVWLRMSKSDDQQVRIEVRDDGVGFEPAEVASSPNAGFGMFSIRERLELFGGRMQVESSPGHGTRVVIQVPQGTPPPTTEAPAPVRAAPRVPVASGRLRVLLADDHPIVRKGLVDLLAEHPGLELVGEARDGQEAIDLALKTHPDVVMMDVHMPRLSGIEATRRITAALPGVRVIGFSMHEEADMDVAMNRAGAVAYLHKDAPPEALATTIFAQAPAAWHGH